MGIGRPVQTTSNGSLSGDIVTSTSADITLYVRTTGSDSNNGLTVGTALLTIQEAVNRIPKYILHDITIDIGEGNFTGFALCGYIFSAGTTTTIKGTLGNPTLTTGTTSGTATGGSNIQLVDSGQAWTAHELRGCLILVNGEYRVARDNDATTIDTVGTYAASVSGKAYEILEQKTVLNADGPSLGLPARIMVRSCTSTRDSLNIQDIEALGGTIGVGAWDTSAFTFTRIKTTGNTYGVLAQVTRGTMIWTDCYANTFNAYGFVGVELSGQLRIYNAFAYGGISASSYGFYMGGAVSVTSSSKYLCADNNAYGLGIMTMNEFMPTGILARNNTKVGLVISDTTEGISSIVDITDNGESGIELYNSMLSIYTSANISSNGQWGIRLNGKAAPYDHTSAWSYSGILNLANATAVIENNGSGGITVQYNGMVRLGATTGTNTGQYGLELETGSCATITSATAITGATGDATINDGVTNVSWATDFASDGDMVSALDNKCVIERKD